MQNFSGVEKHSADEESNAYVPSAEYNTSDALDVPMLTSKENEQKTKHLNATRRKMYARGAACVCCFVATFLILFFLIPRTPTGSFVSETIYFYENPLLVTENMKVTNPNYYEIYFGDFQNVQLDTNVIQYQNLTGGTANFKFSSKAQLIGGSYVKLPSMSTQTFGMNFYCNTTASAVAAIYQECLKKGVNIYYSGSITTWTSLAPNIKYTFKLNGAYYYRCTI